MKRFGLFVCLFGILCGCATNRPSNGPVASVNVNLEGKDVKVIKNGEGKVWTKQFLFWNWSSSRSAVIQSKQYDSGLSQYGTYDERTAKWSESQFRLDTIYFDVDGAIQRSREAAVYDLLLSNPDGDSVISPVFETDVFVFPLLYTSVTTKVRGKVIAIGQCEEGKTK